MGIEVSMGIGSWVKQPEELLISHSQAEQALQYRYLLSLDTDNIEDIKTNQIFYTI